MEDQAGRISPELQEAMEAPRSNTQVVSRKKHVNMGTQPTAAPLDFSWKEMKDLSEIIDDKVVPTGFKGGQKRPTKKSSNTTILAGSNELTNIAALPKVVDAFFTGYDKLLWLDISHNRLTTIDKELLLFPNLTILYMHGNEITKLKEVDKLAGLTQLKKLTLHANPIEEIKNYRLHVFTQIPSLRMLDFINMTKVGRDKAQTWEALKFKPKDI